MSRSFLKPDQLLEAQERLKPPAPPDGETRKDFAFPSAEFSDWLLEILLQSWRTDPDFERAGPILIGSGARRELAPRSDLDLLMTGPDSAVRGFVGRVQQKGIKIRARTPEDLKDWTVGVEVPDVLALFEAMALTPASSKALQDQQELLFLRRAVERKKWLKKIIEERTEREKRFDSIANVLEPNLKYGPGGLRDLDQARQIARIYPELFSGEESQHALGVLAYYADFWTTLRQRLHLDGHGDVLMNTAQFDLARWLGMQHKNLMREVQRGLTRVHFYATWIAEKARGPEAKILQIEKVHWKSRALALKALQKNPSVLMQNQIRQNLDGLFSKIPGRERGKLLWEVLKPGASEDFVRAVFGSRLIDRLCPSILPLIGHVQHDQYHRYTADIHLQQACRQFQRLLQKPKLMGPLAGEVRALTPIDQKILAWSVLFHDLMKGREGDHSHLGRKMVKKEFALFGLPSSLAEEVGWLVEHHLDLSIAAFRKNPWAPATWSGIHEIGAKGARLRRLAVFTVIDICATNPEAWNPWKARLLNDLLKAVRSPSAQSYFQLQRAFTKQKMVDLSSELDSALVAKVPANILAKDLEDVQKGEGDAPPQVVLRKKELWVRFHHKMDRPGLFAEDVQKLFSLGLGVRHASIQTLKSLGAYNWFQVTSKKSASQIRAWLSTAEFKTKPPPKVTFQKVSLVSQDQSEWVLSFKGLDQPGCLAAAAMALADEGMNLKSARVHTWGRQIDDLFSVEPKGEASALLARLQKRFSS